MAAEFWVLGAIEVAILASLRPEAATARRATAATST
jgi:hypothetical protein